MTCGGFTATIAGPVAGVEVVEATKRFTAVCGAMVSAGTTDKAAPIRFVMEGTKSRRDVLLVLRMRYVSTRHV
jgi:hypothetical protein